MRALTAPKNKQSQTSVWFVVRQCRGGDNLRTQRVSGERHFALPAPIKIFERAETGGDRGDTGCQQPVGAPHDTVLLVQDRRDPVQARCQKWRHGRIAAEADDYIRPDPAEQRPGFGRTEREQTCSARERYRTASAHSRTRNEMDGTRRKLEMRGAMVGGELDR